MLHPRALALLAVLVIGLPATPALADAPGSVTASGEGRIEVAPDIAWLHFGVSARQATVAAARDEVARGVARLIALARDAGLQEEQISTAALSVSPEFDWDPQTRERRLLGYVVSRQVTLKLTDLDRLGELTEQALGLGVTDASPASFDSSRRAELETEALVTAVRDARRKAEAMAGALGVGLGAVQRISAVTGGPSPQPMLRMAMAEADTGGAETYRPGLIRVTASVTVRFTLESR
jgi:uncharacterized protein